MKITIVTGPWLPTPAIEGGATNRIWNGLAQQFAHRDHEVTVVCKEHEDQPQEEVVDKVQYLRYSGFTQTHSLPIDLGKDLLYGLLVLRKLPRADILLINDFWLPVLARLRRGIGKSIVIAGRYPKGQYRLYSQVDQIVAVSHAVGDAIKSQFPACADRVEVVSNPIDTDSLNGDHVRGSGRSILYAGRIHPEKGLELLIDAVRKLVASGRPADLRIVGPFTKQQGGAGAPFLESLRGRAENLSVEFVDPIFELRELAEEYSRAHVFCYPSLAERGEAFGVSPLEAMASGAIPVVSKLECFHDTVIDNETGYYFDHRSSDPVASLAEKLDQALEDAERNARIRKNGVTRAQQFSYTEIADRYIQLFRELLR